jgi:ABC-type branched-subunit amino acid transport system substrate-binding protein
MIIAKAIEKAGTVTDSERLRDALAKTDYQGMIRRYTFAENGQAKLAIWITTLEKGK